MPHVNILKKVKLEGGWKLLSIPRNPKGNYDWTALPAEGFYLIEWRSGGKRRRASVGATAAERLKRSAGNATSSRAVHSASPDSSRRARSQKSRRCI